MSDDDLEGALNAPITGRQVASWALDVLEDLYANPALPPSSRSQASLDRLAELGEPARVMGFVIQAAAMVVREAHLQSAGGVTDPDEMVARSFLRVRSIFGDDEPRNPFKPSDQG